MTTSSPTARYELNGADSLRTLRTWITTRCARHCPDLDRDTLGDIHLVATELATNAIEHADGPRALRLTTSPDHSTTLIEVDDASPDDLPTPGRSSMGPHRGRGLVLTSRLATWGVRTHPDHKTLWACVPVDGAGT